jgi:LacI family transcriptional regulator
MMKTMADVAPTALDVYAQLDELSARRTEPASDRDRAGNRCVAVVFTHWSLGDEHAFFGPLVAGLRTEAAMTGHDTIFCAPGHDYWLHEEDVEHCIEHGADAIVVLGGADGNPDVLSRRFGDFPAVFVEYDPVGGRSAHIGIDNEDAFSKIVVHLATSGRSRIATICGLLDARDGAERLAGYRATLARIGYPPRPEYIASGDFDHGSGYAAMQRLLALDDPPDAVACASDAQAVGALRAIAEAGLRCPEDIAVTGFDDAPWAALMRPALTTVRQPAYEMGQAALGTAVAMVEDPSLAPPTVLMPGELVVRESCGAHRR